MLATEKTEALLNLSKAMDKLDASSKEFAGSLLKQARKRELSEKQWFWVNKLIDRANTPKAEEAQVGDLSAIMAMFTHAKGKLKWPKVHLQMNGAEYRFNIAGSTAKVPGSLTVLRATKYAGRILQDGTFQPSMALDRDEGRAVAWDLRALAMDPVKAASTHGHQTGNCCFCRRFLTDKRSVDVGYGPVCADNFGLPWGVKEEDKAAVEHQILADEVKGLGVPAYTASGKGC